jgi:hypothetical protein
MRMRGGNLTLSCQLFRRSSQSFRLIRRIDCLAIDHAVIDPVRIESHPSRISTHSVSHSVSHSEFHQEGVGETQ